MSHNLDSSISELSRLITEASEVSDFIARVKHFSAKLLNKTYKSNALIGSAIIAEDLVINPNELDCVTYVETVLALANSSQLNEFLTHIRNIRYSESQVDWLQRNHYMSNWIRNNSAKQYLDLIEPSPANAISVNKLLNCVPDLPACSISEVMHICKTEQLDNLLHIYQDGDLIFFGSSKIDLDIFHMGFLFNTQTQSPTLRHASRTTGFVVDEALTEFLIRAGGCSGVWIARPKKKISSSEQSQK
jgi:hypothetical protein